MKDDVNEKVTNGTLKTLICSNNMLNWDGVLKSNGRLKVDYATHLGSMKRPITWLVQSENVHM